MQWCRNDQILTTSTEHDDLLGSRRQFWWPKVVVAIEIQFFLETTIVVVHTTTIIIVDVVVVVKVVVVVLAGRDDIIRHDASCSVVDLVVREHPVLAGDVTGGVSREERRREEVHAGKGNPGDVGRRREAELAQQLALDALDVQPDDVGLRQPEQRLGRRAPRAHSRAPATGIPRRSSGGDVIASDVVVVVVVGRVAGCRAIEDGDKGKQTQAADDCEWEPTWRHAGEPTP